jgi:hypothetical protein
MNSQNGSVSGVTLMAYLGTSTSPLRSNICDLGGNYPPGFFFGREKRECLLVWFSVPGQLATLHPGLASTGAWLHSHYIPCFFREQKREGGHWCSSILIAVTRLAFDITVSGTTASFSIIHLVFFANKKEKSGFDSSFGNYATGWFCHSSNSPFS